MYINHGEEEIGLAICVHVRDRDNVLEYNPNDINFEKNYTPVLVYATTEKGYCGHWLVELKTENFDKNKIVISTVQTVFGRFIDGAWYGNSDEELYFDMDESSTITKATSAKVGWIYHQWSYRSKQNNLEKILRAKNSHVNVDRQGSIQGFDLSKYV